MSAFYKMDPAAWDFGTTDLTLEQEAAYLRIINAIHKHDQPVPDNDRVLAGLFRCSTRKARSLLNALIEAGKVRIDGDKIVNDKAISDLVHRGFVSSSRAESGAKGGRTRAANAANALKTNDQSQANASSRIEENREEKKEEAKASSKKDVRGSRLSADWRLPKAWGEWAVSEGLPEADTRQEGERFCDYWAGVSGAKGVKLDWQGTWRNWVRKAIEYRQKPQLRTIVGGRGRWQRGEIRVLSNGRVQEYDGYQWEFRNDLTPDDVAVAHA